MNDIIALFGRADSGKTHCLRFLLDLFREDSSDWNVEGNQGTEFLARPIEYRCAFTYHGVRIAISTFGDYGENSTANIEFAKKENCQVLVVPTRTSGASLTVIQKYAKENHVNLFWRRKFVTEDSVDWPKVNRFQAELLKNTIVRLPVFACTKD